MTDWAKLAEATIRRDLEIELAKRLIQIGNGQAKMPPEIRDIEGLLDDLRDSANNTGVTQSE